MKIPIAKEDATDPDSLHGAPWSTPVGRLDEAQAAKCLNLCWVNVEEKEEV